MKLEALLLGKSFEKTPSAKIDADERLPLELPEMSLIISLMLV